MDAAPAARSHAGVGWYYIEGMPRSSPVRIRIVLAILLVAGALVLSSVSVVIRALVSTMSDDQESLALTAINLARLYADISHPGPWEARGEVLYKGDARMSGSEEVTRGLRDYLPPDIAIQFGAGVPPVSLTRPAPPWWERFLFPRPADGGEPPQPPPSDTPTYTKTGAFLGLRGADAAIVGWIYVAQGGGPGVGRQNSLFVFLIGAGAVVSILVIIVLSLLVFRLSKPIDTIVEAHGKEVLRNVELSRASRTDSLTGLLNRRGFLDVTAEELQKLSGNAFIAMFDIDHFKLVNDTRGHECGDAVLAEFARVLQNGVRRQDYCARWGGEEFLALLVGVDAEIAQRFAERLRATVESHAFGCAGQTVPVTVTVGLSRLDSLEELPKMIDRADKALYLGKQSGRNRVVLFGAPQ
jgi:diguanylate cyclase (GGDEF)-like protein